MKPGEGGSELVDLTCPEVCRAVVRGILERELRVIERWPDGDSRDIHETVVFFLETILEATPDEVWCRVWSKGHALEKGGAR